MNIDDVEINSGVVRPMECLREGWQLIKEQYWFFFGIAFLGVFIGGMASPFLVGPMMCGIYMCYMQHERGKKVTFEMLFQGFHFFVPSLIATLIMVVPIVLMVIVLYGVFIIALIAIARPGNNQGGPPDEGMMLALFGGYGFGLMVIIAISVVVQMFFLFVYMLIVDKGVSAMDAIRLSIRGVRANLGGVICLVLLSQLLSFIGLLCCIVGAYLEMPISFAMFTIAYRQVFPHHDPFERFSDDRDDDEPDDAPRRRSEEPVDTAMKVDNG